MKFNTISASCKNFAREARKQNKAMEKCVLASKAFKTVKDQLITIIGHC